MCWVKANPLLGVTVQPDYLAGVVRQAKAIPGKLNNILRLHFCVWTEADTAWMSRPALEACLADFEPDTEHTGEPVYLGVDLSATQDMTAVAFVVPTGFVDLPREDGSVARLPTFDAWVEAWTPADTLAERALRDNAPYDLWVREGWLNAAPGRMVRFDFVAARLAELVGVYEFRRWPTTATASSGTSSRRWTRWGSRSRWSSIRRAARRRVPSPGSGCLAASWPWSN